MADKNKIVKRIKNAGTLVIYIGTASLMKPYITRDNDERNAVGRVCSVVSGATISVGIAEFANRVFCKVVDDVANFIDDVRGKNKDKPNDKKDGES